MFYNFNMYGQLLHAIIGISCYNVVQVIIGISCYNVVKIKYIFEKEMTILILIFII